LTRNQVFEYLVFRTWWTYSAGELGWIENPYHFFNLFEGTVWVILAILVFYRYIRCRHSLIEVGYSLAFLAFGLTDFREAYALQSWLIWLKGANLLVLIWLRSIVIRRYYPMSKLY
jgi:hypothetical protein